MCDAKRNARRCENTDPTKECASKTQSRYANSRAGGGLPLGHRMSGDRDTLMVETEAGVCARLSGRSRWKPWLLGTAVDNLACLEQGAHPI